MRSLSFFTLSHLLSRADLAPPEPIVDGLIHRGEFILLSAPAKAGKSLLSTNLAMSVASGSSFLGKSATQGTVMMIQTEVTEAYLKQRITKMLGSDVVNEKWGENLLFSCQEIRLNHEAQWEELTFEIENNSPSLVIFDPFYTLHDCDENTASEIAPMLWQFSRLAKDNDTAVS